MFGDRLRQLRKDAGITQEQLDEIIGVERSSVGKYEGKSKTVPSDDVKEKIAEYFNVSIDYLLGRTDDPAPPSPSKPKCCTNTDPTTANVWNKWSAIFLSCWTRTARRVPISM